MLATEAGRVDTHFAFRRYATALGFSIPLSLLMMFYFLGLLRHLGEAVTWPEFWMKVAFAASLAGAGFLAVVRLARPGRRLGYAMVSVLLPIAAIWVGTVSLLVNATPVDRMNQLLGQTWAVCPFLIAMLSAPILLGMLWAVRGLAPTDLPRSGAACGLFSGALGALVYSLHCPEMSMPFIGTWYLLGILIPTGLGYYVGRTVLRW